MEIKKEIKIQDHKSILNLDSRKRLSLTGVQEVISFNEEEIDLTTELGQLKVRGNNLKMNKLDVQNGELVIIGTIDSCVYMNKEKKKDSDSIISKLFK
ncbi:sporulation protein YabP [Haloimpatiens lingqiaonensis]|uniref:sporulation protein YabP n=1 Tax=Haloimpatiens lingqiaonensis TaxID=1380675 RepID=UPI0010FD2A0D|nr:sporulation protein YabP [Haloimpatiens lingqiaonensis]